MPPRQGALREELGGGESGSRVPGLVKRAKVSAGPAEARGVKPAAPASSPTRAAKACSCSGRRSTRNLGERAVRDSAAACADPTPRHAGSPGRLHHQAPSGGHAGREFGAKQVHHAAGHVEKLEAAPVAAFVVQRVRGSERQEVEREGCPGRVSRGGRQADTFRNQTPRQAEGETRWSSSEAFACASGFLPEAGRPEPGFTVHRRDNGGARPQGPAR